MVSSLIKFPLAYIVYSIPEFDVVCIITAMKSQIPAVTVTSRG